MSIAAEILSLRHNQCSSMKTLLAALEWEKAAEDDEHVVSRGYAVTEAADVVLLNVAVYATEALSKMPVIRGTRRGVLRARRKPRRPNPGRSRSVVRASTKSSPLQQGHGFRDLGHRGRPRSASVNGAELMGSSDLIADVRGSFARSHFTRARTLVRKGAEAVRNEFKKELKNPSSSNQRSRRTTIRPAIGS